MNRIDHTHDIRASSWVAGADSHRDFPIQNLPFGVFRSGEGPAHIGTAIGDFVLDLAAMAEAGLLPENTKDALRQETLNTVFALPGTERLALRHALFAMLSDPQFQGTLTPFLIPAETCAMQLPAQIGDYTDFYVGIHHAENIGRQFRPDNPLLPNYKYVPIGYHGRASSIRVSGTPVHRPSGQIKLPDNEAPIFGPSKKLDYELEMGVWIAGENALGQPVDIKDAHRRIAGLCLLNDWSARDIQAWEYQPLGPFLAKNFLTTISPWVITAEALIPFRTAQVARVAEDPHPLPYLWDDEDQVSGAFAIDLTVTFSSALMRTNGHAPLTISHGPMRNMYWTIAQMIAHHSVGGCNLMPGDLLGTGTISGPNTGEFGSLIETTLGGQNPLSLPGGETRSFLESGDNVMLHAQAVCDGYRTIGFGACAGQVI